MYAGKSWVVSEGARCYPARGSPPRGRTRLRNRYLVLGIGVALLAAVTIIVVGAVGRRDGQSANATPSATQSSLPPGHPAVTGGDTPTTAPTTGSSVTHDIKRLQQTSKAQPGNTGILLKLGDAYFLAQQYARAEQAFGAVLQRKPGDPAATVRMAMVWQATGQTQRAVKAIQGVLQTQPKYQEAHYSMAIIYFSMERVQDARNEWAKAAALDPSSVIGRRSQNFVDLIDGKQSNGSSD
jgi:cytochrome c-type biogenesis protein CcmH/NrfG